MNEGHSTGKARAILDRFGVGADEESDDSVREPFEEARPRSREDIMLDVRFSTGSRHAFSYAY